MSHLSKQSSFSHAPHVPKDDDYHSPQSPTDLEDAEGLEGQKNTPLSITSMAHPFSNPLPDCSSSSYHNVYEQASSSDKAEVDLHSYSDINQRLFQAKTKLCLQEIAALFTINEGFIKLIKDHLLRSTAMRRFRTISSEDDPAYQIREYNQTGSSMENQGEDINRFETISGQYQESILGLGDIYDGRSKAKVSYYKIKDGLALSPRLRATSSINPLLKKNGGRISLPLAWNAKRSQSNRYLSPDNLSKEKKLADLMGIPEIKGLPEKSEPEGNGGGGGKPQILKKLISQRKLLNTTKKALGDTLLPDGSSQNAPSEIDSKEFRIHVYPNPPITTQSHIPSKFKPKLNQEPKKPANQCQPQRRLQDLLLNDSPNKVGQNKGEREMRAALKFLRRLGQTLREKSPNRSPTGHTPGGLTGQDRNTPRAGDETSNSSRQYPQSFGDVVTGQELLKQALENSSRCEDIIRQDKSEHVSPTDRNPAVQTSLEEGQENLSMLNEGVSKVSLSQIMNGQSPINLDDEELEYLVLAKEYRQYDEMRFKAHRQKYQQQDQTTRHKSMKIDASPPPSVTGYEMMAHLGNRDLDSLSLEKGELRCSGFKIHLEETQRASFGPRGLDETLHLNFLHGDNQQERSISPIGKDSSHEKREQISPPDIVMSNQKCQTSRNALKTKFSLHLFETSNDIESDPNDGRCQFGESVESIRMSDEHFNTSSQVSLMTKIQNATQREQHPKFRQMKSMQDEQQYGGVAKSMYKPYQSTIERQYTTNPQACIVGASGAQSTYTRVSGMSNRQYSVMDFKNPSNLKNLKNSLHELSISVEKGAFSQVEENHYSATNRDDRRYQNNISIQDKSKIMRQSALIQQARSETKRIAHNSRIENLGGFAKLHSGDGATTDYGLHISAEVAQFGNNQQDTTSASSLNKGSLKRIQLNLKTLLGDLELRDAAGSRTTTNAKYGGGAYQV